MARIYLLYIYIILLDKRRQAVTELYIHRHGTGTGGVMYLNNNGFYERSARKLEISKFESDRTLLSAKISGVLHSILFSASSILSMGMSAVTTVLVDSTSF